MNTASCLSFCDSAIDKLQSIIEKLKVFPLPVYSSSNTNHQQDLAEQSQIRHILVLCTSLGLTILQLRAALSVNVSQISTSFVHATAHAGRSIVSLRNRINKMLIELFSFSSRHDRASSKYNDQFKRAIFLVKKLLSSCSERTEILIEAAQLRTLNKTTYILRQMVQSPGLIGSVIFTLPLDDVHAHFEIFVANHPSGRCYAASKGTSYSDTAVPSALPSTQVRSVLDVFSGNTNIENLLSSNIPRGTQLTRAELEGFVSRTKTTRREPNWKSAPVDRLPLPHLPPKPSTDGSSSTTISRADDGSSWPLGNRASSDSFPSSSTSVSIDGIARNLRTVTIDEVYDSHHSHDIDATLDLPDPTATAALNRHPARQKQLGQVIQIRMKPTPSRDTNIRKVSSGSARMTVEDNHPGEYRKAPVTPAGTALATQNPQIPMNDIRDQYY